jgi:hypothetical protein
VLKGEEAKEQGAGSAQKQHCGGRSSTFARAHGKEKRQTEFPKEESQTTTLVLTLSATPHLGTRNDESGV